MLDIQTTLRVNRLLDFYSNLLTNKQRTYLESYFKDDLSLAEIADEHGVSRNAVHDNMNRSIKLLENYESQLQLIFKFEERSKLCDAMRDITSNERMLSLIDQLEELE